MRLLSVPFKPTFAQHFSTAIDVVVISFGLFFASCLIPPASRLFFSLGFCWYAGSGICALVAALATGISITKFSRWITTVSLSLFLLMMLFACFVEPFSTFLGSLCWYLALWSVVSLLLIAVESFVVTPHRNVMTNEPEDSSSLCWKRRALRVGAAAVTMVAISVSIAGAFVHAKVLAPQLAALTWQKTTGEILEVKPIAHHRWNMQLDVRYQYEVDGTIFVGTRDRGLLSRHDHEFNTSANDRVRELSHKKFVDVYFNAVNPSESFLTPGATADGWMGLLRTLFYVSIIFVAWWSLLATRHHESNRIGVIDRPPVVVLISIIGILLFTVSAFYFLLPGVTTGLFFVLHALVIAIAYVTGKRLVAAQAFEDAQRTASIA